MKVWTLALALAFAASQNAPEGHGEITGIVERSGGGSPLVRNTIGVCNCKVRNEAQYIRAKAGIVLTFALLLTGTSALQAQTPRHGSVHGVVRVEGINIPLEGFEVQLAPVSKSDDTETQVTDSSGHFTFENIAIGNRQISILHKEGYFARISNAVYSSIETQTVIVVSDKVTEVAFSLIPGGNLSGRVYDPDGHEVANASVWLLQLVYQGGVEALVPLHDSMTTDENGEFQFRETQPGRFYIAVDPDNSDTTTVDSVTGAETGLVRTFFPNTTNWKQATPVTVRPGEETSTVDIHLRKEIRGLLITGQIVNPFSKPFPPAVVEQNAGKEEIIIRTRSGPPDVSFSGDTMIRIIPHDRSEYFFQGLIGLEDDGSFDVDVSPGTYDLLAQSVDDFRPGAPDCKTRECRAFVYGMVTVEVRDRDIGDVRLNMVRGFDLHGRVLLNGNLFKSNSSIRIVLLPESGPLYGLGAGTVNAVIEPDGTFHIPSVTDGHYRFRVQAGSSADTTLNDVYVADILAGNRSVYDSGIDIRNSLVDPVTISLKTNSGTIAGTVVDAANRPVFGKVVLVPAKEHRSNPALYKTIQSEASGRFTMNAIPPGNYTVFAWEWAPNTAEQNGEYLRQFEAQGTPVTIKSGTTVDIRVTQVRSIP